MKTTLLTAVGSAFVDNIVFVSTFIPIVKKIVTINRNGINIEHKVGEK